MTDRGLFNASHMQNTMTSVFHKPTPSLLFFSWSARLAACRAAEETAKEAVLQLESSMVQQVGQYYTRIDLIILVVFLTYRVVFLIWWVQSGHTYLA